MKTGKVQIDYQDMYGNTALHYAVYKAHENFIHVCIDEFKANLCLLNNGEQSVLKVINEGRLALVPDEDWTVESATEKAHQAAKRLTDDASVDEGDVSDEGSESAEEEAERPTEP